MASSVDQHDQYTREKDNDPEIQSRLSSGISLQFLRQTGPYCSQLPEEGYVQWRGSYREGHHARRYVGCTNCQTVHELAHRFLPALPQ